MTATTHTARTELELRLLGPLEVWREGELQSLPQSKKTRALLAYLAMSGRSHRRERLCDLLWDVADDPRGALRWSLSKLRRVVNDDAERITADRESVAFAAEGARIDALMLTSAVARGVGELPTDELERLAELARGEFLDGLELPDFHEFQSWCVAVREQAREARGEVLAELVRRLSDRPRRALPYARARVHADAFSVPARVELLRLLVRAGKRKEATQLYEIGCRMLREVGAPGVGELEAAWRELPVDAAPAVAAHEAEAERGAPVVPAAPLDTPFVGRRAERDRLFALHDEARARGNQRAALISGEPGSGKSRLAETVIERARAAGTAVLYGRAFEAESSRPYGPWVDALGSSLADLAPQKGDRDALFAAVADAAASAAVDAGGALLVLDDVQWLDSDSAELLHFVARMNRQRPLFVLLIARSGELADNEPVLRVLRSLRREIRLEEVSLAALSRDEIAELVGGFSGVDPERVFEACAGNPMYALELARAAGSVVGDDRQSLVQLVRERIDRIPPEAAEVLRWGAVLGHAIDVQRLESLSSLDLDALVGALESLERYALLRVGAGGRYEFAHDVVREAVYGELSHPRRRLMHQQVAKLLAPDTADAAVATEVAHHASLAGDASLGVQACITAGRNSLRVFANGDANTLARRGLRLVEELDGADRIAGTLELLSVHYAAHMPDRPAAIERVRELTDQALDLGLTRTARLGFHLIANLRWEGGSIAEAHESIMQAERVSRSADPAVRSVALGEAAKCLLLLEKNLEQAEAFVLEADSLIGRGGRSTSATCFAMGMLHDHRGEIEDAIESYGEARRLAREQGDRLAEFYAVEHWVTLELDRGRVDRAHELAVDLAELGARVREGSEEPCSRALLAFAKWLRGDDAARAGLEKAAEELRLADGKYRLCLLLSRWAGVELERGDAAAARELAEEALELATIIGRPSEMAMARSILVRVARASGDAPAVEAHLEALAELGARDLSAAVRRQLDAVLAE